ncbi:MAG: AGE family epimerase/isomerase [Hyphomonadaceae bacterium]|nr:AGE family epimerase/isomerase [Hyphomonadaceae bacterium]
MVDDGLKARAIKARDWMLEASFPFWADHGVHPVLGFRERLTMAGDPIEDSDTRVRLQARQTFCFAFAQLIGWQDPRAKDLVARGIETLTTHCQRPDGLYGARMAYAGGLSNASADLYDTAFALLALSWATRTGANGAAEAAAAASAAIESVLKRPASEGGYREALPAPELRLQNPHMHLFESSLAFHEATGDADALARAKGIESLLETRFLLPEIGALREVFTPNWGPAPGDRLEAGHQYEWVWLMAERARLDGKPVSPAAEGLYANALKLTGSDGAVALSHTLDGQVLDATERTWGLTEALKAHLARIEQGDGAATAHAIQSFDRMWARHVDPAPEGGWLDKYGPDGQPDTADMTAATGYHIYVAIAELMRVAEI